MEFEDIYCYVEQALQDQKDNEDLQSQTLV